MDAPAMLPENIAAEEGGQQQMHQDEKEHKPMLKRVKDKLRKIKNTIAGHGHDHDHEQDTGDSNSTDEDEVDAAMREAEVEKGGYQQDIFADSSPEQHGAPMYDSERIPAAAKEVKHNDAPGVRLGDLGAPATAQEVKRSDFRGPASAKEVKRDDTQGVRLGDLGSPVVQDPAVPNSRTPMPRGGEDIGTTDAVRNFEAMTVSDDPKQVGARKMDVDVSKEYEAMPVSDATGTEGLKNAATGATGTEGLKNVETGATGTEGLKDAATDTTTEGAPGATYTDMIKSAAAGTTEYGKKLASTVYDMIKSAVAGTTEYGKKLASTVYEKVAGVGTAVASKAQQAMTSAGTTTPVVGATTWATATPGVGAQDGVTTRATVSPGAGGPGNGQDNGVTGVTAHIAEKLRPGDEERSLSEAITGAVQQRKEGVRSTVAQAVTRARSAVTSLTGGNRVSETVQPTREGNIGEGVTAEGPVLHGAAPRTNTNVM